jgi:hypothetical protein
LIERSKLSRQPFEVREEEGLGVRPGSKGIERVEEEGGGVELSDLPREVVAHAFPLKHV